MLTYTQTSNRTLIIGIYRDAKGELIDLRPKEGKPCYENLAIKSERELFGMLVEALEKQIEEVKESPYIQTEGSLVRKLETDLRLTLESARNGLSVNNTQSSGVGDKDGGQMV